MTYITLDEINQTDLASVLSYPSVNNPEFFPLMLFTFFVVITLVTFFREVIREGKGNFLSSLAVGSFVNIAITAIFLLLRFIPVEIGITSIVLSIVIIILYLFTDRN